MAEILIRAKDNSNLFDAAKDRMCYKAGYPVTVRPDGHVWGAKEVWPDFALIKIPGIPVSQVTKYTEVQMDVVLQPYRRRLWTLQWANLPQAVKDRLRSTGELTIKAGTYTGPYDYTWTQVKQYFLNQFTGQPETAEL